MRNVSEKSCRESPNTHSMFIFFFRKSCLYEIMWKNVVQSDRLQMIIWHMRIALWINRATNTHKHTLIICNISFSTIVSVSWQLTIYAFPPGQVLSYCWAGAMGVVLGVVDNTIFAKKQKNLLSWFHAVLTVLACMTSICIVPCEAWETEYSHYIVKPKLWHGLQRFQKLPIKNNVF